MAARALARDTVGTTARPDSPCRCAPVPPCYCPWCPRISRTIVQILYPSTSQTQTWSIPCTITPSRRILQPITAPHTNDTVITTITIITSIIIRQSTTTAATSAAVCPLPLLPRPCGVHTIWAAYGIPLPSPLCLWLSPAHCVCPGIPSASSPNACA